jgi:hypothetical protein
MKATKLILTVVPMILYGLFATGCAQLMAVNKPKPFTPSTLITGAKRVDIVAELGQPITSETHSNQLVDAYRYVDGGQKNSTLSKTSRVLVYTAGDIFTCWLDQVVWMPAEAFGFPGTVHAVTVDYSKYEDGFWHATTIDNKVVKGRAVRSASVNPSGLAGVVPVPVFTPSQGYQPTYYAPPTIHYTGSGIGAIQAGLMNNLGRR